MNCFFVSDLHGKKELYLKLVSEISSTMPDAVFIGGDITSNMAEDKSADFFSEFLFPLFDKLKQSLQSEYPNVFIILGNDDPAALEDDLLKLDESGLLKYMNCRKVETEEFRIFGYNYVPPTPFLLKDWERYDVSRYIDPGDVSPEEGYRTVEVETNIIKYSTIAEDLAKLTEGEELSNSIFLFHAPPHNTKLDRVANDNKFVDHVPLDLNVGSIAVRRFIEKKGPLLTLHGHIHESTRLTGSWAEVIGSTHCFNAAHDGRGLSLVKFNTSELANAVRVIL